MQRRDLVVEILALLVKAAQPAANQLFEHAVVAAAFCAAQFDRGFQQHQTAARIAIRSEEHTSELQSLMRISYAVFCLKKKKSSIQTKYNTLYIMCTTTNRTS